jgi:hypothetical protein
MLLLGEDDMDDGEGDDWYNDEKKFDDNDNDDGYDPYAASQMY